MHSHNTHNIVWMSSRFKTKCALLKYTTVSDVIEQLKEEEQEILCAFNMSYFCLSNRHNILVFDGIVVEHQLFRIFPRKLKLSFDNTERIHFVSDCKRYQKCALFSICALLPQRDFHLNYTHVSSPIQSQMFARNFVSWSNSLRYTSYSCLDSISMHDFSKFCMHCSCWPCLLLSFHFNDCIIIPISTSNLCAISK